MARQHSGFEKNRHASTARLEYIDLDWGWETLEFLEQERRRYAATLSAASSSQVEYALHGDTCTDVGFLHFALGSPLHRARSAFHDAACSYLKVFELRGTQPGFPATVVTLEPDEDKPAVSKVVERRPLHPPDAADHSLTNSRRGFEAMCLALITEGLSLARQIAVLVGDPEDATYIGENSPVCTPDQQRLAYGLKALLLGNVEQSLVQLGQIRHSDRFVSHQARLFEAVASANAKRASAMLNSLLHAHRQRALLPENLKQPYFYLSLAGLAACIVTEGVPGRKDLPTDNALLPLALLDR